MITPDDIRAIVREEIKLHDMKYVSVAMTEPLRQALREELEAHELRVRIASRERSVAVLSSLIEEFRK